MIDSLFDSFVHRCGFVWLGTVVLLLQSLLCSPSSLKAQTSTIIQDFEAGTGGIVCDASRGCSLKTTDKYFVISGKHSAEFDAFNADMDRYHPPDFYFSTPSQIFYGYKTFSMWLLPLPSFYRDSTMILVQFQASGKNGHAYPNWVTVPCGKPVKIGIPLNGELTAGASVQTIIAVDAPGVYYFDDLELSDAESEKGVIKGSEIPGTTFLPNWFTFDVSQQGLVAQRNKYLFDSKETLHLDIQERVIGPEPQDAEVWVKGPAGEDLLSANLHYTPSNLSSRFDLNLSGNQTLEVSINGHQTVLQMSDVRPLEDSNLRVRDSLRLANPLEGRGIVSCFAGMTYDSLGYPNVTEMIDLLKDLGVNCYSYLIDYHSEQELAKLPEFCSLASKAGIEVWVYLVPPTDAVESRDSTGQVRLYPPYGTDYLKWAEALGKISLEYPNFTLWMVDDFSDNFGFFNPAYWSEIYDTSKAVNPRLMVGGCIYYHQIDRAERLGYPQFLDAVLWGYQDNALRYPNFGKNPGSLIVQIHDYHITFPRSLLIPCIYFTPHSSWRGSTATQDYMERAMDLSFTESGVLFVYVTPKKGNHVYDLVKAFCQAHGLEKWK